MSDHLVKHGFVNFVPGFVLWHTMAAIVLCRPVRKHFPKIIEPIVIFEMGLNLVRLAEHPPNLMVDSQSQPMNLGP
jgi:hypothetical protein